MLALKRCVWAIGQVIFLRRSRILLKAVASVTHENTLVTELENKCMKVRRFRIMEKLGTGMPLKAGMTIAIEPMVLVGTAKHVFARQMDGSICRWIFDGAF